MAIPTKVCRPMKTPRFGGKHYFLILIAAAQRFVRVYVLKNRMEVEEYIYEYITWIDREGLQKTKRVHTDSATKFPALHTKAGGN